MSGDALDRAVRALRASGDLARRDDGETRRRVLRAVAIRGRRRRGLVRWGLPLAAALALSSAWAASGGRLGTSWLAARAVVTANGEAPVAPRLGVGAAGDSIPAIVAAPPSTPDTSPPVVTVEDLPAAPAPGSVGGVLPDSPPRPRRTTLSARAPAARAPPAAETDDLYAVAHRAHFVDRNPAAALAAWDAYLRAAPSGALAPEARYNRALCLVRLGRREDAIAALQPFASRGHGSYRQREAAELVETLQRIR
jgi:hypothetical protein